MLLADSGVTIAEGIAAIQSGRRLPCAPGIASYNGQFSELDGTAKGGRATMLGDLLRPSMPSYIANGEPVIFEDDTKFIVHFQDGQTLVAETWMANNPQVIASGKAIADKIEGICGAVHPKQLASVYFSLSQSAVSTTIKSGFTGNGIASDEHMALTFSISKNAETGAVIIAYSEPAGFPIHFSWTTTVALDGSVKTTPMVVEQ